MKKTALFFFATFAVLAAFLSGCGGGGTSSDSSLEPAITSVEQATQHGTWTVLVYLDADNDLESAGINNFNQMEKVGSSANVRIAVEIDRAQGYDTSNGNWTDTRRYLITRDNSDTINSIRMDTDSPLGEKNMADPQTLRDFVQWGMSEFPADHYCLILWDHGSGWETRTQSLPQYKAIMQDNSSGDVMNITDIETALSGIKLDVIAFDACFMQEFEVAYQLRNCADYMVGSCATEPSPGYNYYNVLKQVNESTTPAQLCKTIVNEYENSYPSPNTSITMSAVDLSQMDNVANAASTFAQALISNESSHAAALASAREASQHYSTVSTEQYSIDMIDFANRCASITNTTGSEAASAFISAVNSAVIDEIHNSDMSNAHGLAIYLPPPTDYSTTYSTLDVASDTYWDEWIKAQKR